jgi:hypothetical protein
VLILLSIVFQAKRVCPGGMFNGKGVGVGGEVLLQAIYVAKECVCI